MSKTRLGWIALILVVFALISVFVTMLITEAAINQMEKPPEIKIVNRSGTDLQNVSLEGSGFNEQVGTIQSGESRWITIHPTGESGVYVSFVAGGSSYKSDYESYFESSGGYRVIMTIDKNFNIDSRYASFLLP